MGRREEHALKQLLRITILLIGLIWILAWAAAGRFDDTPSAQDGSESPLPSGEITAPGERDSAKTLRVQIQGEVQEMDMGTYLLGVLRAEMPASFEEEALKAQASPRAPTRSIASAAAAARTTLTPTPATITPAARRT